MCIHTYVLLDSDRLLGFVSFMMWLTSMPLTGPTAKGMFGNSLASLRYKLYQFSVTDGMRFGRPVMYAFVISEKYASLQVMFQLLRDMMGIQYPVSTMAMNKFAPQMRAARVVFGCDVLLCYFHVRQAITKHVSTPILHGLCHF